MSGYRGRTGPNFSEYLNNLNTLTSPYDQEHFPTEELDISQDLAMFTNTDFTHFDIPSLPEDTTFNFDLNETKGNPHHVKYEDLLSGTPPGQNNPLPQIDASVSEPTHFYSTYNTPIQPAPAQGFGNHDSQTPPSLQTTAAGAKQKGESIDQDAFSPDDKSRVAAEEDKRRRNTAASARFRVKKKLREQTLEKTVKEVQDKNSKLEAKVSQLEMENKWLKALITEKNGISTKEEMTAAYQQYRKESEERDLKTTEHTTGVGTN